MQCIFRPVTHLKSFPIRNLGHFTHSEGMVDIGSKVLSAREAVASCLVRAPERIVNAVFDQSQKINQKGNIVYTSTLAGVMGAKRTADLIPMCHQISLSKVRVNISRASSENIRIVCHASAHDRTGVEMEALTGASISALTLYDMAKSAIKGTRESIVISELKVESKTGGSSSSTS